MTKFYNPKVAAAFGIIVIVIAFLWCAAAHNSQGNPTIPGANESQPDILYILETMSVPLDETPPASPLKPYTDYDIEMLAKTVWGEARGCAPDEQWLVVWTVLQRVDADNWGGTILSVVTAPHQFQGYREGNPVDEDIYALCAAELGKWAVGEAAPTHEVYAPTVPYFFFEGSGRHNWFRAEWR